MPVEVSGTSCESGGLFLCVDDSGGIGQARRVPDAVLGHTFDQGFAALMLQYEGVVGGKRHIRGGDLYGKTPMSVSAYGRES